MQNLSARDLRTITQKYQKLIHLRKDIARDIESWESYIPECSRILEMDCPSFSTREDLLVFLNRQIDKCAQMPRDIQKNMNAVDDSFVEAREYTRNIRSYQREKDQLSECISAHESLRDRELTPEVIASL